MQNTPAGYHRFVLLRLDAMLRRQRSRVALLAAVIALGGTVAATHGAMGMDHADGPAAMCLAVLESVAGLVLLIASAKGARTFLAPPWRRDRRVAPRAAAPALARDIRVRAGPPVSQVFRL